MRRWWRPIRRGGLLLAPLLAGTVFVGACATVTPTYQQTVTAGAVAGPTLDLFWQLAAVQVEHPATTRALLAWDPRGPAEELERLGVEIGAFREEIAKRYGVHAVVLFLTKEENPWDVAREKGFQVPGPGEVAFLSGPLVDTVVLLQPGGAPDPGGSVGGLSRFPAGPRVASLARRPPPGVVLSAVYGPAAGPDLRRYAIRPRTWEPEGHFEHVRCGMNDGAEVVTRLVYRGGSQDTRTVRVSAPDLEPCPLTATGAARAVIVDQEGRKRAGRPVIVAASYVLDPYPGPLLADWIEVP